eukprot:1354605-Alexandrium_andersonii.AAC.1
MDPQAVAAQATRALGEEVRAALIHAHDQEANAGMPMVLLQVEPQAGPTVRRWVQTRPWLRVGGR